MENLSKALEKQVLGKLLEMRGKELREEWKRLQLATVAQKKQIELTRQNIQLAKEFMNISFDEYKRGVKGSLEILEAQEKLFDLEHDLIKQKKDFLITQSKIQSFQEIQ